MIAIVLAAATAMPVAAAQGAIRPDNLCTVIPAAAAKVLLLSDVDGTLDSRGGRTSPAHRTCRWEARPRDGSDVRVMTLTVDAYADAAAAQAAMRPDIYTTGQDTTESFSDALVRGSGDRLSTADDDVVQARHGVVVATVDASAGEVSIPNSVQRYWTEVIALAGAGAGFRPPPAYPGIMPAGDGDMNGVPWWHPPAHDGGIAGRVLAVPVALMRLLATWRFGLVMLLILGGIALVATIAIRLNLKRVMIVTGAYAAFNMLLGTTVSDWLVYHLGTAGAATITDGHGTAKRYNNYDVTRYDVLIRTAEGETVSTHFEDDDFNVYPPRNRTAYPGVGDQFTVRYMPGFPRQFVIVANDAGPWSTKLRCGRLMKTVYAERQKAAFANAGAPPDPRVIAAGERRLADAGC